MSDGLRPSITRALRDPPALASCNLRQWEALVLEARRTNLLSRLAHEMTERGLLDRVPPAPRAHLVAAQTLAQGQADAMRREVTYIRKALARTGIDIVLLKGAAYLMAGLPAARGRLFTDVDILVPFERLRGHEVGTRGRRHAIQQAALGDLVRQPRQQIRSARLEYQRLPLLQVAQGDRLGIAERARDRGSGPVAHDFVANASKSVAASSRSP